MTIVTPMVIVLSNITASQFKARCLAIMDDVAKTLEPVTITKHGKPVAMLVPATQPNEPLFGLHAGLGSEDADFDPADTTNCSWNASSGQLL